MYLCVWTFIGVTLVYNIIQMSVEQHCILGSWPKVQFSSSTIEPTPSLSLLFLHLPTFLSGNHYSVFCIYVFILLIIILYIPQMSEII